MAEAPLCRTCGKREWGHVCGFWVVPRGEAKPVERVEVVVPEAPPPAPVVSVKKPGEFDRVAYQRELMRRRRARAKPVA